jgi:integrase
MARAATGQVIERVRGRELVFAIRFRAYGDRHYVTLGRRSEGWTRKRAEQELENVVADVRRGLWRPSTSEPEPEAPRQEPTFHEFASAWFKRREAEGLRERSLEYLRWALTDHLLPSFAEQRLAAITVEEVGGYTARRVAESQRRHAAIAAGHPLLDADGRALRPFAASTVNKTLEVLAAVLELAVEYGHIPSNPAKGRRRRLSTTRPQRPFLEPDQVTALLDAAAELDAEDRTGRRFRRALLATLAYAGLRIGELLALRWSDVDLANGRVHVRQSKTEAGVRTVDIQPELRDELVALKASRPDAGPVALVFATAAGKPDNRNNVRRRVLVRAVARANERIAERPDWCEPLPVVSPHGLRRTFASWLIAEGEDIAYVMGQLGHTDPKMTLGLYAKALRSKRRRPHARRVDQALEWAPMGTTGAAPVSEAAEHATA